MKKYLLILSTMLLISSNISFAIDDNDNNVQKELCDTESDDKDILMTQGSRETVKEKDINKLDKQSKQSFDYDLDNDTLGLKNEGNNSNRHSFETEDLRSSLGGEFKSFDKTENTDGDFDSLDL